MIAVIIAGGSGTRLWPLSTPDYPKHLLKVLNNESLLQNAYKRAKRLASTVYVITEAGHADHVRDQIPELTNDTCIVEPGRRGTAGCIIAGLQHVAARHPHDEPIAFLHADHVIRNTQGFVYSFKAAAKASQTNGRITLIGIEPYYPATGFGYIEKGTAQADGSLVYDVAAFTEKPAFADARTYFTSGRYLWNCGYFVGSVDTFVSALSRFSPTLKSNYDRLMAVDNEADYKEVYLSFEHDAIDYALLEKSDNLQVVPASFDWLDVGSFNDMHTAVVSDKHGNYQYGKVELEEVENSFLYNTEDKPVAVIGLDNVVVINAPHGILVARKDLSQKVGDVSKRFNK